MRRIRLVQESRERVVEAASSPGPWTWAIFGDEMELIDKSGSPILTTSTKAMPGTANKRLIAAAPEMLEAMQGVVDCPDYRGISTHEMRAVAAAIKKAGG